MWVNPLNCIVHVAPGPLGAERVQCSAKGHSWTHADGQVQDHGRSGKSASARRGGQAGEQAGGGGHVHGPPWWLGPTRVTSAKQLKAFPGSPRPATLLLSHKPYWGGGRAPPLHAYQHFQNASTSPFPPPLGSFPCLGVISNPIPTSPGGTSPVKGTDCNFFFSSLVK